MFNHMTPSSSISTSASSNIRTASCCISAIIRRILCFNHLTSSARALDRCLMYEESSADVAGNKNPPGVVAKLMGLESLPITDRFEQSPSLDSRRKSRSVKNRQIIPIYEEFEDENFFILSFEKGCDYQRRRRRKSRKRNKNVRRESLYVMDKENRGINIVDDYRKDVKKNVRVQDDLENLSPNSVLDDVLCADDEESSDSSSVIISRLRNSKIRTLSEEIEDNYAKSKEEDAIHVSSDKDEDEKHHKWDEIGKLATSEMANSSWIKDEISHFIKETIGRDLSLEIFDQLISEEVAGNFD